jgi:hypothetical protein
MIINRGPLPSDWPRWNVEASLIWDNSFNVVDNMRTNRFGEPWVELCAVTLEQAADRCAILNLEQPRLPGEQPRVKNL